MIQALSVFTAAIVVLFNFIPISLGFGGEENLPTVGAWIETLNEKAGISEATYDKKSHYPSSEAGGPIVDDAYFPAVQRAYEAGFITNEDVFNTSDTVGAEFVLKTTGQAVRRLLVNFLNSTSGLWGLIPPLTPPATPQ
jgi:hypothetical protein